MGILGRISGRTGTYDNKSTVGGKLNRARVHGDSGGNEGISGKTEEIREKREI